VKDKVHDDSGFSSSTLGIFDTTYLFCYGIGNYISGTLGDNFPIRLVVPAGLLLSALCYSAVVILGYLDYYNVYLFSVMFGLNGFA